MTHLTDLILANEHALPALAFLMVVTVLGIIFFTWLALAVGEFE